MLQITLKPLPPPHAWDVLQSERVHPTLKIKAMMQRENVYSSASNSTAGVSPCSSSNNHTKKNSMIIWCSSLSRATSSPMNRSPCHEDKHAVVEEFFDESMISSKGNFIKRGNIYGEDLHQQMMCEWSYRIVDHISGNRELVAISQNYINRFLGKYHCNVKGYKLVVITCLYLAIKLHNQRPLSMKSLTDLNGNEITIQDITEMESMVLKTLNWNLCPPTASGFCTYFFLLWPTEATESSTMQSVLQRSCFFSELSLFDNSLVLVLNQSEIAFAATLNALEELSPTLLSLKLKLSFIHNIALSSGIDHTSDCISLARDKIWALYQQSR